MGRDLEVEEEEEWEGSASSLMEGAGRKRDFPHNIPSPEGAGGKMSQERPSVFFSFCKFVRNAFCLSYLFVSL